MTDLIEEVIEAEKVIDLDLSLDTLSDYELERLLAKAAIQAVLREMMEPTDWMITAASLPLHEDVSESGWVSSEEVERALKSAAHTFAQQHGIELGEGE